MATPQSTSAPLDNPEARIRDTFAVTGRIIVHPEHECCAITDTGRVFVWTRTTRHRSGQLRELSQGVMPHGYHYVRLRRGRDSILVHRLVAELFLDPPAEGQDIVRHMNGEPTDNRAENLAWGTQTDNMQDMIRHGRSLKGERSPQAKLTARRVRLIRELLDEGFRADVIAHLFNTSEANVNKIGSGEAWAESEDAK